ncbi:MAG: RCC1 domain-containing protein [Acidimicrobiales bacterium]
MLETGGIDCWGNDPNGELGDGSSGGFSRVPVGVVGITDAVAIAGTQAMAPNFCAVLATGGVDCWGNEDGVGALGNGSMDGQSAVAVPVTGVTDAVAISGNTSLGTAGYCALLGSGGIDCWGDNGSGELGAGSSAPGSDVALAVTGIGDATSVRANGTGSDCALITDGTVACWGNNSDGMLGNDSTETQSNVPVPVSGVSEAQNLSIGGLYGFCAVVGSGAVDCWGAVPDESAPLGPPAPIGGISDAVSVFGNTAFDSDCAVRRDATVACWGQDENEALGSGATGQISAAAIAVPGVTDVASLISVPGGGTFCALRHDGTVECWGFDNYGELGDGTGGQLQPPSATAVEVLTAPGI